ncbi:hypothetical protein [Paremcibacter congregatus]|uniref:hypothetical protein n=1 Tax=Paremcibacter congregatus TaxID=2043170 RepID=UPI0030EEC439|tara:strand:- start:23057 stop:23716 length:660 start_codon:yes stop_codon:yes gene_type:complete
MTDGYVVSIMGQRGTGKSTLMNQIIRLLPRVILFDYLDTRADDARKMGFHHSSSLQEVKNMTESKYAEGFKIWYQPPPTPAKQQEALSRLSHILWDIQLKQRKATGDQAFLTFAIDELSIPFPVTKLPTDLDGFNLVLTGGRHYGFNVVGASQRPAHVSTEFRSAAEVKYFLQLSEPRDLDVVGQTIGKPEIDVVKNLQKLEWRRSRNGHLTSGKTLFL